MDYDKTIEAALRGLKNRQIDYARLAAYYGGKHPLNFATKKFKEVFGAQFQTLKDNLCPVVVDTPVERLEVEGFSAEAANAESATAAWAIWQRNRLELNAAEVHREAFKCGDAYVIVWPDGSGRARIYPQPANLINVTYDEETGEITQAAKCWQLPSAKETLAADERANLYYPDRIEKYVRRGGGRWAQFSVEGEAWPLPNSYGRVPVFHFANAPGLQSFGQSELSNVTPLQDALNKSLCDMFVGAEFISLPQRWATGLETEIDEATGKPVSPFQSGVERLWAVANEAAKFGQFDQASLGDFLKVQNELRAEMARISGTPFHYLMLGQQEFPSGEAMKTAEARFQAKLKAARLRFGQTWAEVLTFALLIEEQVVSALTAQWVNTAPRSENEFWGTQLLKKEAGVSEEQILSEGGYTAEDIARMKEERAAQTESVGEKLLRQFNAGTV